MERAVPILPVDDLAAARRFYVDALGFAVTFESSDDGRTGVMGIARGSIALTLDCPMDGHGRHACVSLQVDSADRYHDEWRARTPVLREPRDEPWGARTFDLLDPFGNTIFVIGPPAATAPRLIDEMFVRQAIDLSRQARFAGNHPFGALLVVDGVVVATAQNTVNTDRDPTAHAETNLVAQAIRHLNGDQIARATLYTSCEPCAMCTGKMYWAGIRSVVYALSSEALATLAGRDFLVPCRDLFARAEAPVTVVGPRLEAEAREVHVGYWPGGAA